LFREIVVCDSHPRARALQSDFLKVESCVELFLPLIYGTTSNGAASNGTTDDSTATGEIEHAKA